MLCFNTDTVTSITYLPGFCVSLDRDSMRVVAFESMDNLDDYTKDGV